MNLGKQLLICIYRIWLAFSVLCQSRLTFALWWSNFFNYLQNWGIRGQIVFALFIFFVWLFYGLAKTWLGYGYGYIWLKRWSHVKIILTSTVEGTSFWRHHERKIISSVKFRDWNKLVILRAGSRAVLKGLLGFLYIKRMHDLRNDNEEEWTIVRIKAISI